MSMDHTRRAALMGLAGALQFGMVPLAQARQRLTATPLGRWPAPEAKQGVAVDAAHFYGIGNRTLVKHRKSDGARVGEWTGPQGGPTLHLNCGYVDEGRIVLAHSNYPQLPPLSSIVHHDARTLQPIGRIELGARPGSLTWAVRRGGYWWACFAYYNGHGRTPGFDNRASYLGQFDDTWQALRTWHFPGQFIASWGESSSSGGDWGDDGLLYASGHDAPELQVMRLPARGKVLEHVATIGVPFEGQGWAWDRSLKGDRVIYGISRASRQVIATRIPAVPAAMLAR